MSLTDLAIRNAKPKEKPYKLSDGGGLFLWVQPTGRKWWRYAYRYDGKQKLFALGIYPEVTLAEAREAHMRARKVLATGIDPNSDKREAKRKILLNESNSFESVAREWHEIKSSGWDPGYSKSILTRLEGDVLPHLGHRPINDITSPELLAVVRLVEKRDALELAQRILRICGQVFMYGIVIGRAERNPAVDLQGALKTAKMVNFSHLKENELPEFLQKLEKYHGTRQFQLALKLLILTFVRTAEIRGALWSEIDFDKAEWRIPAERMKMRRGHIVPLSSQALDILKELKLMNGQWEYVFPHPFRPGKKSMSENGILNVIYRMGYKGKVTGHGFRHTASTILNENGFNSDWIERQLAHVSGNKIRAIYNHAEYLPDRRRMMQWWADHVDSLRNNNDKAHLHKRSA
jgi:integrase